MDKAENKILEKWGFYSAEEIVSKVDLSMQSNKISRKFFLNEQGEKFMLDSISADVAQKQEAIGKILASLKSVEPSLGIGFYLKNKAGNYFEKSEDKFFGISPFFEGTVLIQETYLEDAWRAVESANFLLELKKASQKTALMQVQEFSIKDFLFDFSAKLKKYNPREYEKTSAIFQFLENDFLNVYAELPKSFCHGDFHALNIIWQERGIEAVLDWEFSAICVELYDVAFMLGCLGMENPVYLKREIVRRLVSISKRSDLYAEISWKYFFDLVLAIRLIWLSQWLKVQDTGMIDLEIEYLNLLFKNRQELLENWKC